ncbi:hypothetical protein A2V56_02105 [Candidatus Woesebacteria bacterium RBG_19FT_COMBO_42_9]|nr:MAG: hypothetical protein A2V56_02105 [Candidatus Woesebacteria bacterium RBG_19FT_COMBO_42_9]
MDHEIIVEQVKLQPPDARKRTRELINQRGILPLRELIETGRTEGWDFGIGVDILDYILAQRDQGKIKIMQLFLPGQNSPLYIISHSLLDRRESPTST